MVLFGIGVVCLNLWFWFVAYVVGVGYCYCVGFAACLQFLGGACLLGLL